MAPPPQQSTPAKLTEAEELEEYDKIVEFNRQVWAGIHARVKIPEHILCALAGLLRRIEILNQ